MLFFIYYGAFVGEKIFFYKGLLVIVDIGVFKNHGFIPPEQIVTSKQLSIKVESFIVTC